MTQFPLIASPHNNQQLFSDHYLDVTLPQRQDWLALIDEAKPIMAQIATIFKKYKPSNNEPQTEDDLVKPVLRLLGHTFEIQAPLATPQSTQKYLLPLLNSSLIEFFFRTISASIRGGYLRFIYQYVTHIPIRHIAFTTPTDERTTLANKGIELYEAGKHDKLLIFVEACLASQPEQSDVVHDLLAYLTERMIDFNKKRQEAVEDLILGLDTVLSDTDLQKISRLWTPSGTPKEGDREAQKQDEAQEILGPLAARQLDLHDDIGLLNEEQWKWLLKQKLGQRSNLVHTTRVYKTYQPSIAMLDKHITITDHLINQIVYRFYSLTPEEIAIVEGKD